MIELLKEAEKCYEYEETDNPEEAQKMLRLTFYSDERCTYMYQWM